jgi:hypothetical protein
MDSDGHNEVVATRHAWMNEKEPLDEGLFSVYSTF